MHASILNSFPAVHTTYLTVLLYGRYYRLKNAMAPWVFLSFSIAILPQYRYIVQPYPRPREIDSYFVFIPCRSQCVNVDVFWAVTTWGQYVHIGFLSRCFIHRVSRLGAENVYSGCVRNAILL